MNLKSLKLPAPDSHKGQNGKVLIIGGSQLFHAAGLWACEIASRIVDMVFFSSTENNLAVGREIQMKALFRNGIFVPRHQLDNYFNEADCILIGPGLPRQSGQEKGDDDTRVLTERVLKKYPQKRFVIDGGSLQEMDPAWIPVQAILTPHQGEFERLFKQKPDKDTIAAMAKKYHCVILCKGQTDIVCSPDRCQAISGGNAGMTKGGTGDVLAGLTAAFYCRNEAFLAATAASYLNKKAGEDLYKNRGYWFNASELIEQIPKTLKRIAS